MYIFVNSVEIHSKKPISSLVDTPTGLIHEPRNVHSNEKKLLICSHMGPRTNSAWLPGWQPWATPEIFVGA